MESTRGFCKMVIRPVIRSILQSITRGLFSPIGNALSTLLQLPQSDATGFVSLGSWEDGGRISAVDTIDYQASTVSIPVGYPVLTGARVEDLGGGEIAYYVDNPVVFSILTSSYSVTESDTVEVQIGVSGDTSEQRSVDWGTLGGTDPGEATNALDYEGGVFTLTWLPGESDTRTVYVPIVNDTDEEPDEVFHIVILNAVGGTLSESANDIAITISANDSPVGPGTLGFTTAGASVDEDAGVVSATIARTGGSTGQVSIDYEIAGVTATQGDDYTSAQYTGTLTWDDGDSTSQTINITLQNDPDQEDNETLTITLSNVVGGASTGTTLYTLTIRANDGSVSYAPTTLESSVTDPVTNITWTFDDDYEVGQYVTGEYFVVGSPTITAISPRPNAVANEDGSMLNPTYFSGSQGYGADVGLHQGTHYLGYNSGNNVANSLPLQLAPNDSLVSTTTGVSTGASTTFWGVRNCACLTVVSEIPIVASFRPCFSRASTAATHTEADVDYTKLGNFTPVGSPPSFASFNNRFNMPLINHLRDWVIYFLHPTIAFDGYGRDFASEILSACLLVNCDYTEEQKRSLVLRLVQTGLDLWGQYQEGGAEWDPDGGHNHGREFLIRFAGRVLGDSAIESFIPNADRDFCERGQTFIVTSSHYGYGYTSADLGLPEWSMHGDTVDPCRPWGCSPYRWCCTSVCQSAEHLLALSFGWRHGAWDLESWYQYFDRWMEWENWSWDAWSGVMWNEYRDQYGEKWIRTNPAVAESNGSVI